MGVSGSGKSHVGHLLSKTLGLPFFDGDDFHPDSNKAKMAAGKPLNDQDRAGWLITLNQIARDHGERGAVIACSALKKQYRAILRTGLGEKIVFIHLDGSMELIRSRMEARSGHFMPVGLLESQFETLEPPKDALRVSIDQTPREMVEEIVKRLK